MARSDPASCRRHITRSRAWPVFRNGAWRARIHFARYQGSLYGHRDRPHYIHLRLSPRTDRISDIFLGQGAGAAITGSMAGMVIRANHRHPSCRISHAPPGLILHTLGRCRNRDRAILDYDRVILAGCLARTGTECLDVFGACSGDCAVI